MGVQFVLLGWEDSVPQQGQPLQNGIQEGIDACDVFALVLYRRWGQDVRTREACTSGTEIEFHLALDRFRQTGTPQILVFFKNLDIASMADPGPQLSRVLQFRRSLEGLREIRYGTFDHIKEFKAALTESLLAYASGAPPSSDVARRPIPLPEECVHAVERALAEARRLAKWLEKQQPARGPAAQRGEQELMLALPKGRGTAGRTRTDAGPPSGGGGGPRARRGGPASARACDRGNRQFERAVLGL